ncbi:zinc ribbon domain-containing protein [Shinella sp. HZN7]|uniref:zinc ribbon domain-containing protein n=1 Tax=Shinella sp. (strain HZN7) TaxID=879274 RepID=UPI000AE3955E|nr:zinc ribbon domain-containing protein [Shinella sp. HZN7]
MRQDELTAIYKKQIEASREGMKRSLAKNGALNATHRPRTLLSGLLFCGCCGGSYARRGQDRYACTNHVLGNGCDNARTIAREALEARVLTGLRERMMAPDMAAEAMRLCGRNQPPQPRTPPDRGREPPRSGRHD